MSRRRRLLLLPSPRFRGDPHALPPLVDEVLLPELQPIPHSLRLYLVQPMLLLCRPVRARRIPRFEIRRRLERRHLLVQLRVQLFEIVPVTAVPIVRQLVEEHAPYFVVGPETVEVVSQEAERDFFARVRVEAEEFLAGRVIRV